MSNVQRNTKQITVAMGVEVMGMGLVVVIDVFIVMVGTGVDAMMMGGC